MQQIHIMPPGLSMKATAYDRARGASSPTGEKFSPAKEVYHQIRRAGRARLLFPHPSKEER
jgi:hypothetical protein